jgi:2-keto-4-pentenoate hydratase/2-oxohepta-3-ene-1,7-dioic acid hydratase in catechol pathway
MKIICIEDNYKTKENSKHLLIHPIFFIKPESSLLINNYPFLIPDHAKQIIPKVNIALKICRLGKNIQEKFAHLYYDEFSLGIDMEAADSLAECKKNRLPWETAKAFDSSAPIGNFISKNEFKDLNDINFSIFINGNLIVQANTSQMILSIDGIISYISTFITLKQGDYIFTGSPDISDVIKINDKIECFLENKKLLNFNIK